MTEHSVRNRSLELERTTKDDDAVQYTRIDAKEGFESLHMAVVLPKWILKLELLSEVNSCPIRRPAIREDPSRAILQLNDEDPKLGDHQVVDLRRATQAGNNDPSKVVVVRTAQLKRSVTKERPESTQQMRCRVVR